MAKIRNMQDDFNSPLGGTPRGGGGFTGSVPPVQQGTAAQKGRWRIVDGWGSAYEGQVKGKPVFGADVSMQKTYATEGTAKAAITKNNLKHCTAEQIP